MTREPEETLDRVRYQHVIEQLLEQLNMGRAFDDLFGTIYDRLRGIIPFNRLAVALLEDNASVLRLTSCRSDGRMQLKIGYAAYLEGSTLAALLRTGQPRLLNDLEDYLRGRPASASTQLIVLEGMRSSLTLPLVANGTPIGVLFFSSRRANVYTDQHAALLRSLAGHIAISIERAQLIAALQDMNQQLVGANAVKEGYLQRLQEEVDRRTAELQQSENRYRLLVKLGQLVNASLDLKQVFQHAAEELRQLLDCEYVSLVQNQDDIRHGFGLEFDKEPRWTEIPDAPLTGSAAEWVMQRRVPRIARCLASERQFPEDERLFERGYGAYVYLPLTCRDRSIGVLGVATRDKDRLDSWDIHLLGELCDQLATALDNATAYSEIARLKSQLEQQNTYLRDEIKTTHDSGHIIGDSRAMQRVRRAIRQVATTASTVLILGETGTGKELIARSIHEFSARADQLLVKVNCAALAPSLITSELFGHEAGAFTGAARRRIGRFEIAQRGSIFLDEIAELPLETQVLLLRVLQERVIERVGGNTPIEIDVRVIAATNRDLKQHVADGLFREDLYYRVNVFPIHVPPLRERREDIPSLLNHFVGRFARHMDKDITRVDRRTMELLMSYDWPGNVRELENIIERAMIISPSDTLQIDSTWLAGATPDATARARPHARLADIERQAILDALQQCGGKIYGADGAANRLGLKPTTLYGKMRKHDVKVRRQV